MIEIQLDHRSAVALDERAVLALCHAVLAREGVGEGELGVHVVGCEEIRRLKLEHLGIDESTDVLSFPIDGLEPVPRGVPRQLGDVFLCPEVTGEGWARPLVHGLLHLLGYEHGAAMRRREEELLAG